MRIITQLKQEQTHVTHYHNNFHSTSIHVLLNYSFWFEITIFIFININKNVLIYIHKSGCTL